MNAIMRHEQNTAMAVVEQTVVNGDLGKLDAAGRVTYYRQVCDSLGLNPLTRPFAYITLQGKLTLYALKDAAEQLRKINGISIIKLEAVIVDDLYIVTATAQDKMGRLDQATGAVSIAGLKGEAKANAIMKAETKAKRRVTLSIGGLGWADETEIESIPTAQRVVVSETGEIIEGNGGNGNGKTEYTYPLDWVDGNAAKQHAVNAGWCANEFEARNSLLNSLEAVTGQKEKWLAERGKEVFQHFYNKHMARQTQQVEESTGN